MSFGNLYDPTFFNLDIERKFNGRDFASLYARYRRKRGQRTMHWYAKKITHARRQTSKYAKPKNEVAA